MAALTAKKIFTYEDIDSLPEGTFEIIDGERRDMTPTGFEHGSIEGVFCELLRKHYGEKGFVAVGEVGILITKRPFRLRAADVVYISKSRVPFRPKGMLETAPDLIVEIISESNTASEIAEKVNDYLSIGVGMIIIVDPQTEAVTIHQVGRKDALRYGFDEEFEMLEGVKVKLKKLI
ncbi:MAG: Uma2 family endonuclease [Nitrospirae bacterium]|nr:Uma2 family endonuclease [Nitrospirota bacterium]